MIPAFERAKTVHALDRVTTVIGETCYVFIETYAVKVTINAGIIGRRLTYTNWLLISIHGLSYDRFIARTNKFTINFSFMIKGKVVKIQKKEAPEDGYPCNTGELRTGNDRQ
jgi:hypothetical protein